MLKLISKVLIKIARILYDDSNHLSNSIISSVPERSIQEIRAEKWFKDKGDKTHRLNYELNENSIVFDVGGYEGQWASDIFSKFLCNIHIFEPYQEYAKNIQDRFKRNKKIYVHSFGLSNITNTSKLSLLNDSSSLFKSEANATDVEIIEAAGFIDENQIDKIDLMKINIEGGEYDLLDHLIDKGLIKKIENIQIQFHDFVTDAEMRMRSIQSKLSKTHYVTYQYEFVWENWALKK
ncbi:FkbM family methyltransferase [Chitinophagaceae bacterium LB-8]|uniref:FkbM family methyltransferase n=1 Tax=Paraflavisolibacter caeni TaxID=2982496 RepID=A0A9X2XYR9_9BACT|nr:FkbM family methyltransferase [Paraflavisolibacter caeni]MCU7551290.1 FkbM family methyltransferase [Paraflavisolibacter caeni]